METFELVASEALTMEAVAPLSEMYTLSPFVWRKAKGWEVLLRAVPRRDDMPVLKIARIYYGRSQDGLHFVMDKEPALAPGPRPEDLDGCEDPTVAIDNGTHSVYYSGWNEQTKQGVLLLATGPDGAHLEKQGVRLASTPQQANPKEATIVRARDGSWRLFYEFAADDASQIGLASAPTVDGPWTVQEPLFGARRGQWDDWHLSTGPLLLNDPQRPVMFYNGATQDAKWRIGWVMFDADYTQVIARSQEPLIVPPPPVPPATDIAFAASAVEQGEQIYLYYSVADQEMLRATLRRASGE